MSDWTTLAINDAFNAHGIRSSLVNGWASVDGAMRTRATAEVKTLHSDSVTIQLNVVTEAPILGASGPIVDSFAGLGDTEAAATKNAFEKYLRASFHVVAESLTTHQCNSQQVDWENWLGRTSSWRVCSGPLLTLGTGECKTASQYNEVLRRIKDEFLVEAQPGPHWLHAYVGFLKGKLIGSEMMLDGKTWGAGKSMLTGATWAPSAEYESLRHLLIALPVAAPEATKQPGRPWWRVW